MELQEFPTLPEKHSNAKRDIYLMELGDSQKNMALPIPYR